MTRAKTRPSVHKPVFDEERTVKFALGDEGKSEGGTGRHAASDTAGDTATRSISQNSADDRFHLTLLLKQETITRLEEEAARKGKSVDQIVTKLVSKHLGKR